MNRSGSRLVVFVLLLLLTGASGTPAEEHIATALGNPATRFAKPLQTPEDLRRLLTSETMRADVESIIRQCSYQGDLADLRRAALEARIDEWKIPVGTRLEAMSTRTQAGHPMLLRNVVWAGKAPIDAYEFSFTSRGRRFRVVSPKICSNFWVEDKGPEPRPVLALSCNAPAEVLLGRPANICLSVANTGNAVEPLALVSLPVPAGATFVSATAGGSPRDGSVLWELRDLPPSTTNELCAIFTLPQPGTMTFASSARGKVSPGVESQCETRVAGVPAILLEVVDLTDPLEVGKQGEYEIKVLNQGSTVLTRLKLVCTLEDSQQFISARGTTPVTDRERILTMDVLPALSPKETATWNVVVKALGAGDVRFATELTCDQIPRAVQEIEATRQY